MLVLDGVTVHSVQFAALAADRDVRESQGVQHGSRLRLRIVPGAGTDLAGRLTGKSRRAMLLPAGASARSS